MTDWPGTEEATVPGAGETAWPGTEEPRQNFFDMPEADRKLSRLVPNINHIMKGFNAFGEGFGEAMGSAESLGFSPENKKWLVDVLPKNLDDPTHPMQPFKAFSEGILLPLAAGIDAVSRTPAALYRGAQSLAVARGIPPDIASIPDAFMGSPHPLGIPRVPLEPPKPFVKQVEIKPIDGSPNPGMPRTEAAKTGDPLIDAILDHPVMKEVIENPVVDDSHTIPNSLGGSTPIENPTLYRDKEFPKTMTVDGVTFDTAEPSAVHENVEEFVIDALTKGGMDQATALKVAFWNFGEVAEDAWYRAHGIDPERVEARYTDILNKIAARAADNVPEDLFKGTYPDGDPAKAGPGPIDKPTPEEVVQARQILEKHLTDDAKPAFDLGLDQARDLGVIGPPKVPLTEGTPAEAAARAVGGGGAGGPPEPPAGGGLGAPSEPPQPTGNPWRDRFEHFVTKLDTGDDVRQLIRDAADQKGEFPAARQGNIKLSQVEDVAEAAGVEPGEINQRGLGRLLKNDQEVGIAIQLMQQAAENMKAAARNVRADASPENLIKLQEAIMKRDLAVEQVVGLRAEWGRTGNTIQKFLTDVKDQEGLSNFLKDKGRTPKDLQDIADAVDSLDRSQAAKFMNNLRTPTGWDKFMWYYVNSLISGLITHGKYVLANAAFTGAETAVVTPLAGVSGTIRRAISGSQEGVFIGETGARLWGLVAGTPDAIVAAAKAARTGLQTPLPGEIAQNIAPKSKNVFQQAPIGGPIGTLIGIPSRGASAIHSFFNFLGYRASIEAQAYRAAVKELPPPVMQPASRPPVAPDSVRFFHGGDNPTSGGGRWVNESETYARSYRPGESVHYVDIPNSWLDRQFPDTDLYRPSGGISRQSYPSFEAPEQFAKQMKPADQTAPGPRLNDSFWQRRQNMVDNPTKEMMDNAIEEGYRLTYINELSPAAKAISRGIKATKLGQFIMPFTHIPFNILSRGVDYGPAAVLPAETRADLFGKNGAVKQDMAIARMVAGGAVGAWAVNTVLNDRMTGYGPTDPKERAQWLATGHQPYSIRIGDEWVSFNRFGSLGTMLGLYSNLAEVIPHLKPDNEELTKALIMTVHSTGRLLEDEVGFQGLAGLIDAINDPARNGARYTSNLAGGLLPMSSALRQTASSGFPFVSSGDPYMRETKSIVDGLRYYIPAVRQDLLPKRDWLGEPITNAGYGGDLPIPGFSGFIQHRPAGGTEIAAEMLRLDLHPAVPTDRVGGVKLPPKLYDQYQMAAGQLTRQVLDNWIAQPNWYQMPEFVRAEAFRRSISAARQQAGAAMMGMYPQIIQQGVQQRIDQINGVKPTKLQD